MPNGTIHWTGNPKMPCDIPSGISLNDFFSN